MPNYIRPDLHNLPVFFTVCLAHRTSTLLVDHIGILRTTVRETRSVLPFDILAWVTLPDHLHCVLRFSDGDRAYGKRWGMIKSKFSRGVLRAHGWPKQKVEVLPTGALRRVRAAHHSSDGVEQDQCAVRTLQPSQQKRRELGIWQRRFWEHYIRDERDLQNHIRYCWGNPVKHGLCDRAVDWPYSSIHRNIRERLVDAQWAGECPDISTGEP